MPTLPELAKVPRRDIRYVLICMQNGTEIKRMRLSYYRAPGATTGQVDLYLGDVPTGLVHVYTATGVEAAAGPTYYGFAGGGGQGETTPDHRYTRIFVEAVAAAPPIND